MTLTVGAVIIALFGKAAVTCPELFHRVAIFALLKVTKAPDANCEPVTIRLKSPLLAFTLLGESWLITGVVPGAGGVMEWEP